MGNDEKMRRNPHLFRPEEYNFLHQKLLNQKSTSSTLKKIKDKKGLSLTKNEIEFVKKKYDAWQNNIEKPKIIL